ncbi:MAG: hypothetical protein AXA67_00715 [Methylothermaceae bacteria B42]|nr:MAG: hypothetical protein AXA67_00715 [Methylothermaceae bacteria B42]HHJ39700.1 chorismate lyase [Methylothermaceae bacterium]
MFHSCLLREDPLWRDDRLPKTSGIPGGIRSWLEESASLTARLRAATGEIRVEVKKQGWGRPFLSEASQLGLPWGRLAWVREIILSGAGRPLLLARTIAPQSTLAGAGSQFTRLGTRPLGEVLFTSPYIWRERLEWTRLPAGIWKLPGLQPLPQWGRRALYRVSGRPLLVSEFFMPSVFSLEHGDG